MRTIYNLIRGSRASVTALTAFLLFVFVGLLAIVMDLGHLQATKNELANAADAGALAGARGLYQPDLGSNVTEEIKPDIQRARQWARDAVEKNWVDKSFGQIISDADIQIGHWDVDNPDKKTAFTPTCNPDSTDPVTFCNAVRVITRKDDAANLPVTMGFAKFFGIDSVAVGAEAIAYISWSSGAHINQCILPVALPCCGDDCLSIPRCPDPTRFIAAQTDTSVWTTFGNHPANAATASCQLSFCGDAFSGAVDNPEEACPLTADGEDLKTGTELYPIDGQVASVLHDLYDLFIDVLENHNNAAYSDKFTWHTYTDENGVERTVPAWNTALAIVDTCPDIYASHPLVLKEVLCFTVYDVRAPGKNAIVNIEGQNYDYNWNTRDMSSGPSGYIDGCVIPDDSCLMNAPPGGTSGTLTVRPVLVR